MSVGASISAFAFRGARGRPIAEKLAYAAGIAVLMLLLAAWIVSAERDQASSLHDDIPWSVLGLADVFAVWLLGLGMFVLGPAVVAATVASERRAGTLDQLRTTPLTPLQLAAGMAVGAPARFYLLCAGPLAIHVAAALFGVIRFDTLMETLIVLGVGGVTSAIVALCVALAPRQESGGAFVALGVAALLGVMAMAASSMAYDSESARWAFLHPAGALQAAMLQHDGLWRRLFISSWRIERFGDTALRLAFLPPLSVAASLASGGLLLRAACRRLMSPHRPLFSKKQAMALFALGAAGVILPLPVSSVPYASETTIMAFVTGLLLLPLAATLATLSTPSFESWALALRGKQKRRWWHDDAAPHVSFLVMIATFVGALAARLPGFPLVMGRHEQWSFLWALGFALTLPVFALFGSTRYSTVASRVAFWAAVFAHMLFQIITIGVVASNNGLPSESVGAMVVEIGMVMSVAVPAWVMFRQYRLAQRVREGAAT